MNEEKKTKKILDIISWSCIGLGLIALVCAIVSACCDKNQVASASTSVVIRDNRIQCAKTKNNTNQNLQNDPFKTAGVVENTDWQVKNGSLTGVVTDIQNTYYADKDGNYWTYRNRASIGLVNDWLSQYPFLSVVDETYCTFFAPKLLVNGNWLTTRSDSDGDLLLTFLKYYVPSIKMLEQTTTHYVYACIVSGNNQLVNTIELDMFNNNTHYVYHNSCVPAELELLASQNFLKSSDYSSTETDLGYSRNKLGYINDGTTNYKLYFVFGCDNRYNDERDYFKFRLNGVVGNAGTMDNGDIVYNWYDDDHEPKLNAYSDNFYTNGYNDGYASGMADKESYGAEMYNQGQLDAEGVSIPAVIYTIFNAPYYILGGFLDFEIFGINLKNLVFFVISIGIVMWILSVFKTKKG